MPVVGYKNTNLSKAPLLLDALRNRRKFFRACFVRRAAAKEVYIQISETDLNYFCL